MRYKSNVWSVLTICLTVAIVGRPAPTRGSDVPWWKRDKIRFMWGCWGLAGTDKSIPWEGREVPREVFRNVALSGATVFTDTWYHKPAHARLAQEFGMKYFAPAHLGHLPWLSGGRTWINERGEEDRVASGPKSPIKCPLDESVYERWLVGPVKMQGILEGIIDGLHVDWEATEGDTCYCNDCFATFMKHQNIHGDLPQKTDRFELLQNRGIVKAYEENFHRRRVEMFTNIRQKLQAIKPNLLFSSYGKRISDFTRAMHTSATPFIFLEHRHYYNDDRQAWWESYSWQVRKEGYLCIPGGWTNSLFGSQASQVSAARWIYETSINEDGCWLWFEHELTDDILRAYAAADRMIKGVQGKVGAFLFHGERDPNFVTAVEWSGRPELERSVIHRTYHFNDEHLVHVNNVHTEWPMRVRVRFPRLRRGRWTVRDPVNELYFTGDTRSPEWTSAELQAGVVVALEPRSDMFVQVSPISGELTVTPSTLVYSRDFSALPDHTSASAQTSPVKEMFSYVMLTSIYDEKLKELLPSTKKLLDLPKRGWQFKMDKEDIGVGQRWFLPSTPPNDWSPIEIEDFWGSLGSTFSPGWYRADIEIPALPAGKRVYLHFGAVDEEVMLWIDGVRAGDYNRGPNGWDKPFAIDVTGKLSAGRHHLTMRIYNSSHAGGIWKPVTVLTGPVVVDANTVATVQTPTLQPGQLIYTATEPMGFDGYAGVRTIIGNTIRAIDLNGDNHLRLRQLRGHLWSSQISPDGRYIVFVHDARSRGQIHVMNTNGSSVTNISNNAFCDRSPVWSPNGGKIAFMSERNGDWDIYIMNPDGTDQRPLAGNPGIDRAPAWSPNGSRLAWESHVSGTPNIWMCDADGGGSRPVIRREMPLIIERAEEEGIEQVEQVVPNNAFYLTEPVWSPDGKRIASVGLSDNQMVFVLDVDGSRMFELIPWLQGAGNLCWSPDGTRLALSWRTAPQETERSGILVIKADGTEQTTDENPHFLVDVTPQGPRLGGARRSGMPTWYAHGSAQPRRVVKTFASLAWSPDSTALAFSSDMDRSGAFYVYTISPDGGEPRRLNGTKSAWPNEITWRPQQNSSRSLQKQNKR